MGWNDKSIHLIRKPKQDEKPVVEKAKKVKVQPEVNKSPQGKYFEQRGANPESGDMPR